MKHPDKAYHSGLNLLALAGLLAAPVAAVAAEQAALPFDIPAQALSTALTRFSAVTGLQVLYEGDLAEGVKSAELKGEYTAEQALQKLLQGSGLHYRFSNSRTVTLEKAPSLGPQTNATLPAVTVSAKTLYALNDPYSKEYAAPTNTSATKTETAFLETPGSVSVVTAKQVQDRQVFDVGEALKYSSGVNAGPGGRSPYDSVLYLRGFSNSQQPGGLGGYYYRDGFRMSGIPVAMANLDRLELLKGPATVLYGRVEPGGLVNAVYKRPLDQPYYKLEQQFGSYDLYNTSLDATGPVDSNKELLYRFNLQNIDQGSFLQNVNNNLFSISPSLTWKASDATQVNFRYEYLRSEWNYQTAIPIIGQQPANIPLSRFLGDGLTGKPDWHSDTHIGSFDLTHSFNENWSLRWNALFAHQNLTGVTPLVIGAIDAAGNATSAHITAEPNNPQRRWWYTSANLTGNVKTFGIDHKLLFGFDYNNENYHGPYYYKSGSAASFGLNFNIFNPVYGQVNHASLQQVQADTSNLYDLTQINRWYGLYIQDQIELTKQLRLALGGRFDSAEWDFGLTGQLKPTTSNNLSPRYGLIYQPLSWLSSYYQYMESFGTPNWRSETGPLPPETATQHEAGLKAEFFEGRLNSTLAFFHLTKDNFQSTNPDNINYAIAIGAARSQGIELDITGRVTDKLNIIAAYTAMDTKILKDNIENPAAGNLGHQLANVPNHSGSLWSTYDLTDQFTVGAGAYVAGKRQGDLANSYQLPGYVRMDLMAAYKWHIGKSRLTTQLNVNNVLDKQYYTYTNESRFGAYAGQPLTVLGSIRLEY